MCPLNRSITVAVSIVRIRKGIFRASLFFRIVHLDSPLVKSMDCRYMTPIVQRTKILMNDVKSNYLD